MSRVVAFMIQKGLELFEIPPTVATDVRAYWNKKERRRLSPLQQVKAFKLKFFSILKIVVISCIQNKIIVSSLIDE